MPAEALTAPRRLGVAVVAASLFLGACGDGGDDAGQRPPDQPASSVPGAPVEVGDCLPALERSEPAPSSTASSGPSLPPPNVARTVACDEPHIAEVIHVEAVEPGPDGGYPGDRAIVDQALVACTGPAFERYVGEPVDASELQVTPLTPSADSWEQGDRAIVCLVKSSSGEPLTRSVRSIAGGGGDA